MPINFGSTSSLRALGQVDRNTTSLTQTLERLSSGQRINSASDDAAGLSVSSSLNLDNRVYGQATRNINDGLSFAAVAQGSLLQLSNISTRQLELAEQAANGTLSTKQRVVLQAESDALTNEYIRIINSTKFNDIQVFGDSAQSQQLRIQLGFGAEASVSLALTGDLSRAVGNGSFSITQTISSSQASHIVFADVDGDGDQDVVQGARYANSAGNNALRVYLNDGQGQLTQSFQVALQSGGFALGAFSVQVADFDNDGRLDLGYGGTDGNGGGTDHFAIFRGLGNGSFSSIITVTTDELIADMVAGDVNGDGIMDLVADRSAATSVVYLGNGDLTFRIGASFSVQDGGLNQAYCELGDVNNDGILDYVCCASGTMVLLGNGNGTFRAAATYQTTTGLAAHIELSDINRDGYIDIITAGASDTDIEVLLNNGNGTFRSAVTYQFGSGGFTSFDQFTLTDLNGDGYKDLAAIDGGGSNVVFRYGAGDGTFGASSSFNFSLGAVSLGGIGGGDLNGDGVSDIYASATFNTGVFTAQTMQSNTPLRVGLATASDARDALMSLRAQQIRVNKQLGVIGAFESRISTAQQVVSVARESFAAAESQISSVDIAEESASLVRKKILQQASTAILAQSNHQGEISLKLLSL